MIVTGVSPARHGVLGNLVFDRASGKPVEHYGDRTDAPVRVPTLWDRLHATGQRTAAVCWPKTRGIAAVADNIPEFYEQELFEAYASRPLWAELAAKRLRSRPARVVRLCFVCQPTNVQYQMFDEQPI